MTDEPLPRVGERLTVQSQYGPLTGTVTGRLMRAEPEDENFEMPVGAAIELSTMDGDKWLAYRTEAGGWFAQYQIFRMDDPRLALQRRRQPRRRK